jgi:hypothetical protein
MTEIYVSAHREDGSSILGNLDGQGRISAKNYRRTNHYKSLHGRQGPDKFNKHRPYYWCIRNGYDGPVLETILSEKAKYDSWKGTWGAGVVLKEAIKKHNSQMEKN